MEQKRAWEEGANRIAAMHDEYMDASSTDMEHMEGLIKEHQEARPINSMMRL